MTYIEELLNSLFWQLGLPASGKEWSLHVLIFIINIALLVFSKRIVKLLNPTGNNANHVNLFRFLNIVFLILHIIDILVGNSSLTYNKLFLNLALSILTVYVSFLLFNLLSFLNRKKFGATKRIDGRNVQIDNYNSRLIDIFIAIIIIFIGFYSLINIWRLDSMLETTGLYGILIGFFALTNQIWAPDVFYGMVILYSKLIEDGDVIQMHGQENEYIISKVNFIYTVLLDVRNNHRALIKNSKLIDHKIDNLSKKASADGLRYTLKYKIGYPPILKSDDRAQREKEYALFLSRIDSMFQAVYEEMKKRDGAIKINGQLPFQWHMTAAGDFALEYTLYYHIETLPNTKVTRTIRKYIVASRNFLNEEVYKQSIFYGIDLSTPVLISTSGDLH